MEPAQCFYVQKLLQNYMEIHIQESSTFSMVIMSTDKVYLSYAAYVFNCALYNNAVCRLYYIKLLNDSKHNAATFYARKHSWWPHTIEDKFPHSFETHVISN
jgi:hypothetical protein